MVSANDPEKRNCLLRNQQHTFEMREGEKQVYKVLVRDLRGPLQLNFKYNCLEHQLSQAEVKDVLVEIGDNAEIKPCIQQGRGVQRFEYMALNGKLFFQQEYVYFRVRCPLSYQLQFMCRPRFPKQDEIDHRLKVQEEKRRNDPEYD